tara:strand:+ start:1457 stop:1615 length:159 start_codon:yes stop_codon:yes gene_type:complete
MGIAMWRVVGAVVLFIVAIVGCSLAGVIGREVGNHVIIVARYCRIKGLIKGL